MVTKAMTKEPTAYWRLTDKKGDGEVQFLIVISRDLGLDDQFRLKFKAT